MSEYQIGECAVYPKDHPGFQTVVRVADVDASEVYAEFTDGHKEWIPTDELRKL